MTPARKEPDQETYSGRCGARIRMLRERNGLSAQDLAELCGVSYRAVYNWEAGKADPKFEYLPIMAKAFGLKAPRAVLPKD